MDYSTSHGERAVINRVKAGDVELNTLDRGEGHVLLLVHGFPLDHTMWRSQIEHFAGQYWVIAPDLRGFGQSEVVAGTAHMEAIADDLAALLEALAVEGPVTLAGLSMGGYVAWQFWRKYPTRLARLVLCDTRAIADAPEVARGRQMMAQKVESEGAASLAEVADGLLPKMFAKSTASEQPEIMEETRQVLLGTPPAGVAAAQRGMAARPDVSEWLGEIDLPTLVLVGEDDAISPPEEMRGIAQALPNARYEMLAGAGHMSPLEQPAAFNAVLQSFLEETG